MNVIVVILPVIRVKSPYAPLCIVAYRYEIVIELREYSFNTFSEAFISFRSVRRFF